MMIGSCAVSVFRPCFALKIIPKDHTGQNLAETLQDTLIAWGSYTNKKVL